MRVMFVDDEPNILRGLRRTLRPLRNEWQMSFNEGGEAALASMEDKPCDVVVSDMKMPGMDGAKFLSIVQERYPGSIRIALSGETDNHMIYRCVQHAHQYMAKPCELETLVATIRRALELQSLMQDSELKAILANMSSLPSLPEQYESVMAELQSEEPSLPKIADIIEDDVAMSAKILQLVNSAFFGLARPLSSTSEAVMYLGLDVIKSLVLTSGVFTQFEESVIDENELKGIWRHSTQVGSLAKKITLLETGDKLLGDYALMGGMLADVGKLVIAANFPEQFVEILNASANDDRPECEIEREVIGRDHMEIGAYLIGVWGLPNPVIESVAYHHEPGRCVHESFTPLSAVHAATAIVNARGSDNLADLDAECIDRLGLTAKIASWKDAHGDAVTADSEGGDE